MATSDVESGNSTNNSTNDEEAFFIQHASAFIVLWSLAFISEVTIAFVSLRGTIFNDKKRAAAEYLLYLKLCKY